LKVTGAVFFEVLAIETFTVAEMSSEGRPRSPATTQFNRSYVISY